jgi:hypothetical protein
MVKYLSGGGKAPERTFGAYPAPSVQSTGVHLSCQAREGNKYSNGDTVQRRSKTLQKE